MVQGCGLIDFRQSKFVKCFYFVEIGVTSTWTRSLESDVPTQMALYVRSRSTVTLRVVVH